MASFAFCAVAWGALPRATSDALASLAPGPGTQAEVARYRKQVLQPLREAVDRYSTRANLVVTNRRDPTTLHEAMRKGFAYRPELLTWKKMRWFTSRKALLYIHFGSTADLPREIAQKEKRFPLLVKNKKFRIYCLERRVPRNSAHRRETAAETARAVQGALTDSGACRGGMEWFDAARALVGLSECRESGQATFLGLNRER